MSKELCARERDIVHELPSSYGGTSVAGKMQVTAKIYGLPATGSSHHSFLMVIEATELKGSASRPYLPTCIVSSFFSFLFLKEKAFTFSR